MTGRSSEKIKPFDTNLEPTMSFLANGRINLKLKNSFLVLKINYFLYNDFILNLYIVYELNTKPHNPVNSFSLKDCLFGTVKLTKNADKSKFTHNRRGIAFDGKDSWSFTNGFVRNVATFAVDNTSSSHTDIQKSNFLIVSEGPTEDINVGAAEKNLALKKNTKFCLSLHYSGYESYIYVHKTEICKFKASDNVTYYNVWLGTLMKDFTRTNRIKFL